MRESHRACLEAEKRCQNSDLPIIGEGSPFSVLLAWGCMQGQQQAVVLVFVLWVLSEQPLNPVKVPGCWDSFPVTLL